MHFHNDTLILYYGTRVSGVKALSTRSNMWIYATLVHN